MQEQFGYVRFFANLLATFDEALFDYRDEKIIKSTFLLGEEELFWLLQPENQAYFYAVHTIASQTGGEASSLFQEGMVMYIHFLSKGITELPFYEFMDIYIAVFRRIVPTLNLSQQEGEDLFVFLQGLKENTEPQKFSWILDQSVEFIFGFYEILSSGQEGDDLYEDIFDFLVEQDVDPFSLVPESGSPSEPLPPISFPSTTWEDLTPNKFWEIASGLKDELIDQYPSQIQKINNLFACRVLGVAFEQVSLNSLDIPHYNQKPMTNPTKIYSVDHPSGYTYTFSILSMKEAENLIKQYEGEYLEEYSDEKECKSIYLLNDGKIVQKSYVDAYLFNSLKGFLLSLEELTGFKKKTPESFPIKRLLNTKDFNKIVYYQISKEEADQLRGKENGKCLFNKANQEGWELPNGKILLWGRDSFMLQFLFSNMKDYQSHQTHRGPFPSVAPQLCGRNPYGKDFPSYVDALINQLPVLLSVDSKIFNLTKESIRKVQDQIYKHVIDDEFSDKIYLPLLAYLGKTFIINYGGDWEMTYNKEFDTWSPKVRTKEGELRRMYVYLDELLDYTSKEFTPYSFRG